MANTLTLEKISFENIVEVVKSLSSDKKMQLHDILDVGWQEEFDRSLASVRTKMSKFTQKEIDMDIDEALTEVRRERYAHSSN